MPRTIEVKDNTYRMLDFVRRKYGLRSFNDVIEHVLLKDLVLPNDMFGVDRVGLNLSLERIENDVFDTYGWIEYFRVFG